MGNVIVIGAGVSGLSVAWRLHRSGVDVTVLERDAAPGGTMKTIRDNGWLIESGPNSALETTPLFQSLFAELDIVHQVRYANAAADKRYILRDGTLHPLPMSPGAFLRSSLWSTTGKLRLLQEPFIGKAAAEETIAQFVERRLGREFLDYAINPFVAGVYAGNPETLSVRSAFPKLYALEERYGGLIKGMIKGRKERTQRAEQSKDRAKMFSFVNGMQTLPDTIARHLEGRMKFGYNVQAINYSGKANCRGAFAVSTVSSEYSEADAVIVSTPAHVAGELVKGISPDLSARLSEVYYPPVAEVFLGYRNDQVGIALDGFGYLVPAVEKRNILGTIWSSVLFEGRAPDRHVALTTFVGGARQPELVQMSDAELARAVQSELATIMKITGKPVFTRINRWNKAIPQYNLGYYKVLEAIERCEKDVPGLFFCSNFRGGIAVGDCVMSAERTANDVLAFLKSSTLQSKPLEVQS